VLVDEASLFASSSTSGGRIGFEVGTWLVLLMLSVDGDRSGMLDIGVELVISEVAGGSFVPPSGAMGGSISPDETSL